MDPNLERELFEAQRPTAPLHGILCGVDGTDQSEKAARWAARLAAPFHAKLTLVSVLQLYRVPGLPEPTEAAEKQTIAALEGLLRDLSGSLKQPGLAIERLVRVGRPAEVLAELGSAPEIDLLVIGSRGGSPLARALLGTVADRLVRLTDKPVLIVR